MKKNVVALSVSIVSGISFFAALIVGDIHVSQWEEMMTLADIGAAYETPLWINVWTFLSLAGLIIGIVLLVRSSISDSRSAKSSPSASL